MKRALILLSGLLSAFLASAETIEVPRLSAPVNVLTDEFGVPTIVGENEFDVTFVQGYLHARDRFWQMDFQRRAASGTLGELVGDLALSNDIEMRALGLRRAAWRSWFKLSAEEKVWAKAYADGVNAWLAENDLPPEYGVLELSRAQAWSPVDSLVIGKLLAFQLSFDLRDLADTVRLGVMQAAGSAGGFDGTALFSEDIFRIQPMDDRVTVPDFLANTGMVPAAEALSNLQVKGAGTKTHATAPESGEVDPATVAMARAYEEKAAGVPYLGEALQRPSDRAGSNWWVVAGEHTASGYPIMANDPHLSLSTPSVFTKENLVIRDEGIVVSGVAFPGAPAHVQACNLRICWGSTVHPMDVTDVFEEALVLDNLGRPTHTVFDGQREPILRQYQTYYLNTLFSGQTDDIAPASVPLDQGGMTFVVPRRNHGPLLEVNGNQGLSVQFTGWGATRELSTFRTWIRAQNLDDFRAGLSNFSFGSQNFLYADVDGNIAYFASAENPLRADLQNDLRADGGVPPWLIRDGSGRLNHEWLPVTERQPGQATPYQILPADELAHVINPPSGYIANGNNDPVGVTLDGNPLGHLRPGGNGLYYLNAGYAELRIGRIDRELKDLIERGNITVDDMKALQANNQLLDAELLLPYLLTAYENATIDNAWPGLAALAADPGVEEAIGRLAAWDFSTPTGLTEGFDPGKPAGIAPADADIAHSVAATIYSLWRGQAIDRVVLETLRVAGAADALPDSTPAIRAFHHLLVRFPERRGEGASGLQFFNVDGAPDAQSARDTLLLTSLRDALDLLASDEFAPAFGHSTDQDDYRWGRLHRIVFEHLFDTSPFNVPGGGGLSDLGDELPGVARSGGFQAVDASSHSSMADTLNGFMFGHGPARRLVAEMTPDGPLAEEITPGGRSGIFTSPLYANQLMLWLVNDYLPLNLGEDAAAQTAAKVTTFVAR